ncbi:MAG TPA: hypothetical protein VLK36_14895 [Gaiellaceae bacterium]|nr:hypothetical protein [Gaiellaceae bacterium]
MTEYLRLVFGTVVVLAPGAAVARALGQRSAAALLAWATASVFVAWTVVFAVHADIRLAGIVLAAIFVAAVAVHVLRRAPVALGGSPWPWLVGIVLGWFLWRVAGPVTGDGLFHEARVRKLVELGDLHLRTVDEFKDGGLHPGYAFPLWHGFVALVSWVSGVDPGEVIRHAPAVLAPVACALAWEAGVAVFGTAAAGGSVLLATLALFVFGAGHGGAYAQLAQPATSARQLYVPAAIALFFAPPGWISRLALAVVFGSLALVHPTYALFLLVPLVGYAVLRPRLWREWGPAFAAALVPVGLALLWLRPIVDETRSHDPSAAERARALQHYGNQLVVSSDSHYRLAAEVFGRSGAVAVGALLLLPVAGLALRRRWAAFALGGGLLVLLLLEVPWLFVHLSDAVSLSQSRRMAGFFPFVFALVGVFALLAQNVLVLPAALVGGIVLQRLWPGDFDYGLRHGGPALATWIALFGGLAALAVAFLIRRPGLRERYGLGAAAIACFVFPVLVHGARHWSPRLTEDPAALSPRLTRELRTQVPQGAIVLAPARESYRVVAAAPVYVVALPIEHVADTVANDPRGRAAAVRHWVRTNDRRVARRYGATWAIRDGRLYRLPG